MRQSPGLASFIVIAIGLAAAGYLAGDGYFRARTLDRTVVVKGLAEREVPADVAIWPIRFVTAGNNLEALYDTIDGQASRVKRDEEAPRDGLSRCEGPGQAAK